MSTKWDKKTSLQRLWICGPKENTLLLSRCLLSGIRNILIEVMDLWTKRKYSASMSTKWDKKHPYRGYGSVDQKENTLLLSRCLLSGIRNILIEVMDLWTKRKYSASV
ncbi:hypothetical protein CEXT_246541 [Caerostris extrusa]|uniref:Uncharacterized protein n=1 Tax=Caerostris extrusa TaxID=172846 RepID=A0AAV4Q296_CAEEX|nr:hypothetical protein CEXT_246541 [Caerostris extrusa]